MVPYNPGRRPFLSHTAVAAAAGVAWHLVSQHTTTPLHPAVPAITAQAPGALIMASLIPLLHDLLPIFMPSEVRIARGGELVAVEERAERPPWYRSVTPPAISSSEGYGADREGSTGAPPSGDFKPIQLLDHEESEQGPAAGRPHTAGQGGPVSSLHRGGPKVFRKNAMVGYSDKMCVTGKPRLVMPLPSLKVVLLGGRVSAVSIRRRLARATPLFVVSHSQSWAVKCVLHSTYVARNWLFAFQRRPVSVPERRKTVHSNDLPVPQP